MARGNPLHLAHINAYCRGNVKPELEETQMAIDALLANPNVFCESYLSPRNGTRLTCFEDGQVQSKVTGMCLKRFGCTPDKAGIEKCFKAKKVWAVYDAGGYSDLVTGDEGLALWKASNTDVGGSFNVNPPLPRIWLAETKRPDGSFLVDAISTDGGRQVFVMGHPEYDRVTLDQEYRRDMDKGLDPEIPYNYYPDDDPKERALLTWRAHANNLYTNWLNYYVYQITPYILEDDE